MAKAIKKSVTTETDLIYVYVGPSVRGIIQNGSIFRGSRKTVLEQNALAIEFCPKIERLIVADNEIMSAKEKIKEGGNLLNTAYLAVLEKTQERT